jgi:hypothetical protein
VTVEAVPRPQAVDCVVDVDYDSRTLAVRLPDVADGRTRSLWRAAHRALVAAEELGFRSVALSRGIAPTLWAHTDRRRDIAHGRPGEFGTLRFAFPPAPGSAYPELVGRPCLAAIVTIDRAAGHFMACKLYHQ